MMTPEHATLGCRATKEKKKETRCASVGARSSWWMPGGSSTSEATGSRVPFNK